MDKNNLSHVSARNPIQRVASDLKSRLIHAQRSLLEFEFSSSGHLCERALDDLKLSVKVPRQLYDQPAAYLGEMAAGSLRDLFFTHLKAEGISPETADLHALNLSQRVLLLRAFESPDAVLERITEKVTQKVSRFPRTAGDIEVGRNPGDVIDPYILAATQTLLFQGSFTGAVSLTVAHKALMIIENLVGNLHEDVLGEMRGNVRAPEPRGPNQEIIDLDTNPFPGADVVQPPTRPDEPIRFHQIKSKTGSAKGGDGKRLGEQLRQLRQYYRGEVYYDAIVGNTLKGHRSMRGVLSIAPFVIVLVGKPALQVLTRSPVGPHLLLQVYQSAFGITAKETGYSLEGRAAEIVETFKGRTQAMGVRDFLSGLVESVTTGPENEQDSRLFRGAKRRSTSSVALPMSGMLKAMAGRCLVMLLFLFGTAGAQVRFEDMTRSAGIDWTHRNGATEEKYLIETMGGGGAFLDFDGDGWLDIFLVDSGDHARSKGSQPTRHALYRNNQDETFSDVTVEAGLAKGFFGNGAAVGDYDNDGRPDLYVTGWGQGRLFRNLDGKSFEDVTSQAGVAAQGWSTSAAFFDLENDGDLDLFVCRYLDWGFEKESFCGERKEGFRSYCHPSKFQPVASLLYRNEGNGSFTDVSSQSAVALPGKALGVVAGDLDGDGLTDLHVANDAVANFLFRNQGGGKFLEQALESEVAYGMAVKPESGMGTDLGDFDGDGRLDLIVTNIDYEMNNLYANRHDDYFNDVTLSKGNGRSGLLNSGFGVRFLDYDNDGDLDLAIANGHPLDNIHLYRDGVTADEPAQLLENRKGSYLDAGSKAGEFWQRRLHGRGLAAGDYDNDGDIDLLFINNGSPPVLLRNEGGNRNPWWGVLLRGRKSNRDGVGATVTVTTDRRQMVRQRTGGGSYQSAHDPRLHFGLLPGEKIEKVEIRWPSGIRQTLPPPQARRYQTILEPEKLP